MLLHVFTCACMCVCVLGFQGAGGSSHCHHISHRFLLHRQLCEGGHFGDAGSRLFRHYSRGKTPHLTPDALCVQKPLLHSLFSNKGEVSAALCKHILLLYAASFTRVCHSRAL